MTETAAAAGLTTIQSLIWPEQGICTETDLYVKLKGPGGLSESGDEAGPVIHFTTGAKADFGTWFNLFNIGKWREHCALSDLRLRLVGEGEFALTVTLVPSDQSWERVRSEVIQLDAAGVEINLNGVMEHTFSGGSLFFELMALGPGMLRDAAWQTAQAPLRTPELMLSITTFRREEAVRRTVARFEEHIATSPFGAHMRLAVVDNGQSADVPASDHVTVIPNENLGGAGGFSRGLLAARDTGASHCLFMDDDASTHMASLDRTYLFLSYASDPATAVAGAMIDGTHRWAIWENGARFFTRCWPLHMGTDLRDIADVAKMEADSTPRVPDNFYGGWWYFAFPVDAVHYQPFPFFVRGDDVSFSLVHDFNIVTLNGVVSFQDSFTDKESPLTWYLDLRSHMAHHLILPQLDVGRWGVLKVAVWFFLRNLPRMHYETLTAINIALEDVMRGPAFFDENADMAERRGDMKALTVDEAWTPTPPGLAYATAQKKPRNFVVRTLMKPVLNGHLVPFYSRLGRKIVVEAKNRGQLGMVWGASEITFLSADKRRCYTVRHSKVRLMRETWRFLRGAIRFLRAYDGLKQEWRDGYEELTSEAYWRRKLRMTE